MSLASDAMPKPLTSARILAPRALACSSSSMTSTPAPSPSTVPLRFLENGKQPSGESTRMACQAFIAAVVDGGLRGAGDADVDQALADEAMHQADGVGGGGAGAHRAEGRALDAVVDADMGRRRAADELEQHQGVVAAPVLGEELIVGPLDGVQAAGARADDAGRAIGVGERNLELGLRERLRRGRAGKMRVAVGQQQQPVLEPRLGVEILDLAGDLDVEIAHILLGEIDVAQGPDARPALLDRRPEGRQRRCRSE